jgi:hypothetical protein
MATTIFKVGDRYASLLIVEELPKAPTSRKYKVRCDCGTEKIVLGSALRPGGQVSCGCLKAQRAKRGLRWAHREARTAEYRCWISMKTRCLNPNTEDFKHYGGRGITICEKWLNSYEAFLADMGRRPTSKHSIDRVDVNGHYEPGNCRWATAGEQRRNQRTKKK